VNRERLSTEGFNREGENSMQAARLNGLPAEYVKQDQSELDVLIAEPG